MMRKKKRDKKGGGIKKKKKSSRPCEGLETFTQYQVILKYLFIKLL